MQRGRYRRPRQRRQLRGSGVTMVAERADAPTALSPARRSRGPMAAVAEDGTVAELEARPEPAPADPA
eukprot:11167499-Lingulodinium_polyedra.AAC.1